ncbi:MAG: nitroreductase family protein [Ignavibacteriales bacterium]|nr:nitroreductase family protein [Ignavibacteriales bacterium]
MEFIDLAKKRFSSRSFLPKQVDEGKLLKVLEAGRIAPSAVNIQPWHFIVIKDEENKQKIYSVYKRDWLKQAPIIIVVCGDHSTSWKRVDGKDHCDIDIAIAVDHLILQATELDLGTCWVCNFDMKKCAEVLNLPENIEPIVILPLGYPAEFADSDRHTAKRKPLDMIVHREKF